MQLSFDLFGASPLAAARARLEARFPPEQGGGPLPDPLSALVKAILSSQTYDRDSAAAFLRLRSKYRLWDHLRLADVRDVEALIEGVTHPDVKAPVLIDALRVIEAQRGALNLDFLGGLPEEAALSWLERIKGVGRKISAAVLNFSSLRGYAFVIDTHVLHVAQRLGWISTRTKTAEKAYAPLMAMMPPQWGSDDLKAFHWLMKRLGQSFCRPQHAECRLCPLSEMCPRIGLGGPRPEPPAPDAPHEAESHDAAGRTSSLKARIARLERSDPLADWGVAPFGDLRVDACLPGGGLARGRWHEIQGDGLEGETPAAVTGFAAALAHANGRAGAILWALQRDDLHAPGLQEFGLDPGRVIFVRCANDAEVLSVCEEALRTRGIAAAVGEAGSLTLVAGKRMQLACERGGATAFTIRRNLYGGSKKARSHPEATAAMTRWRVTPVRSETHEPGLGPPRWHVALERVRGGRTGEWILEMQNAASAYKAGAFRVAAELADHANETRAGASLSAGRGGARADRAGARRAAGHGGG